MIGHELTQEHDVAHIHVDANEQRGVVVLILILNWPLSGCPVCVVVDKTKKTIIPRCVSCELSFLILSLIATFLCRPDYPVGCPGRDQ